MSRPTDTKLLLLKTLEKATGVGIALYDIAENRHRSIYTLPNIQKYSLYHAVHRLSEDGYIEKSKHEGRILLRLTEVGKEELEVLEALKEDDWDGKFRVVIFDIPEKHRKVRDAFRERLKQWGLVRWQKSTWVSKKDIAQPIRRFIEELGIEDWAMVLVTDDVGIAPKTFDRQ